MIHYVKYFSRLSTIFLLCLLSHDVHAQGCQDFEVLSVDERATLEQRALEKVNDFISYIPEIAAKSKKLENEKKLAKYYLGLTLDLFIGKGEKFQYQDNAGVCRWHDEVKIQTISRKKVKRPKPITKYLKRLMSCPSTKVVVDSCNAIVINKIHKLTDGQYLANADVMVISQDMRDGRYVIRKSDHQVNIYIKPQMIDVFGQTETIWPVYLGDMRIKLEW